VEANTDPSTTAQEKALLLPELRKRMATFLAQRLTLSLFAAGREQELREAITLLVTAKLLEDQVALQEKEQAELIDMLIEGLPKQELIPPSSPLSAKTWTVESLRAHVAPYIADHLGNDLFQVGREAQLAEAVYMLVQEKIREDALSVDEGLKRELMEVICQAMGIPLPSALNPDIPPPVKVETPSPHTPLQQPTAAHEEKSDTRKIDMGGDGDAPSSLWHELTPEFRREILLYMGSRLKPQILASGRADAAQIHVAELLAEAVQKFRVRLTEEEREEILATILSGEGLEFQL
jgi:hypothetical protein